MRVSNDRCLQNLPACACYFSDVPVLVWNRPGGAENHALDRLISQISRLIDSRLFPQQLVGADHIWYHGLNVAIIGVSAQFILRGRDKSCCE